MRLVHPSNIILVISGLLIWAGVYVVAGGGDFFVWTIAKALYAFGVILFVFNK